MANKLIQLKDGSDNVFSVKAPMIQIPNGLSLLEAIKKIDSEYVVGGEINTIIMTKSGYYMVIGTKHLSLPYSTYIVSSYNSAILKLFNQQNGSWMEFDINKTFVN